LGIPLEESSFARRGFRPAQPQIQSRLELIGRTFLAGYHSSLDVEGPEELALQLNEVDAEFRGFAFEGAAMGLSILDYLSAWKGRKLERFLEGPGHKHSYMIHVGAGWAFARLGRRIDRLFPKLDGLLCWLAVDGYGFHEGYFHSDKYVRKHLTPPRLHGYALRAFDQGLGRSIWFIEGADVMEIADTVERFPPHRRADLWSGVGLACAYAGGASRLEIERLSVSAGRYKAQLAQGAAFAAKARKKADNPSFHTELACECITGLSSNAAASVTDSALGEIVQDADGHEPAYEAWRRRIQSHLTSVQESLNA